MEVVAVVTVKSSVDTPPVTARETPARSVLESEDDMMDEDAITTEVTADNLSDGGTRPPPTTQSSVGYELHPRGLGVLWKG